MSESRRSTPADGRPPDSRDRACLLVAVAAWLLFLVLVVMTRLSVEPSFGNVYNIYREAALRWQAEEALYNGSFLYLPTSALFLGPLTDLSFVLGGAIWRSLNVWVFALGIWRLVRARGTGTLGFDFLIVTLPTLLLSWSAARHGQMTLAMGGLMMMGLAALARGAAWRSSLFVGLAIAFKPLAILLVPILVLLRPRLVPHLVAVLLGVMSLPFATADSSYVMEQYSEVLPMLDRHAEHASKRVFPQAIWMLRLAGVELSGNAQWALRLLAALLMAMGSWRVCAGRSVRGGVAWLFTFVATYLLLFSPCTENNTYALMAPCLGLMGLEARAIGRRFEWRALCVVVLLCSTSHALRSAYPNSLLAMGKPIAALVLLVTAAGLAGESVRLNRVRARGTLPSPPGGLHPRPGGDERFGPLAPDRVRIGVPRGTEG